MDWKTVAGDVSKFAPLIGGVIGGPIGAIVGSGAKLLADTLGCDPTPDGISAAIANDPDAYVKIKTLEDNEKARLHEWNVAQLNAQVSELASARSMQVAALGQEDVFSKRFLYYFAIAWSLFACFSAGAAFFVHIPIENVRIVDTINGILWGGLISSIFGFFFGSSLGSMQKNGTINTQAMTIGVTNDQIESRAPADADALLQRMRTGQ